MSNTKMVGTSVLAMGAMLVLSGTPFAADRGSPEDQLACTPDVYRLCSSLVPDEDAIVACLKTNIRALSPACQRVMSRPSTPAANGEDED